MEPNNYVCLSVRHTLALQAHAKASVPVSSTLHHSVNITINIQLYMHFTAASEFRYRVSKKRKLLS